MECPRGGVELRTRQFRRETGGPDEQRLARGAAGGDVGAGRLRLGVIDRYIRCDQRRGQVARDPDAEGFHAASTPASRPRLGLPAEATALATRTSVRRLRHARSA